MEPRLLAVGDCERSHCADVRDAFTVLALLAMIYSPAQIIVPQLMRTSSTRPDLKMSLTFLPFLNILRSYLDAPFG